MSSAIACSSPVKLGVPIARLAHSTSRSRSMRDRRRSRAHAREDLLAEQPDLLVPVRAPELEHDVRAAGRACTPRSRRRSRRACRRSACSGRGSSRSPWPWRPGGRPASIASATGRISSGSICARSSSVSAEPWMFCTLLARYMPAISRAPSRPASRSVAWIEATTVQPTSTEAGSRPGLLGADAHVAERVAHEVGRRDRRRQQAVADLAAELLHQRRGAGDVDRHVPARHVRLRRERRDVGREDLAVVLEALAAEHAAHDLDRVAHRGERARDLGRAALLGVVEEDLGRAEAGDEAARARPPPARGARPWRPAPDGACRAR